MLIGITRVRNESLIIADTLRHYLGHCDRILMYDDASTDDTVAIAEGIDGVEVIRGREWLADRPSEETRHRYLLLRMATGLGADWVLCFDADERLSGPLPDMKADGYRFRLFDGYMTEECAEPYRGGPLTALPRMWGPEYRDILMLFRPEWATYVGRDRREPCFEQTPELAPTRVRHYGKCLSVEHWEETCGYYAEHWPEPYRSKWNARRGKAIHHLSDFGRPLYRWDDVEAHGVKL